MHTSTAFADPMIPIWLPADRAPELAIAEDDDDIRQALVQTFEDDGFAVTALSSGEELVRHLELCRERHRAPDLVLMDHVMPGWYGLEILEAMEETGWKVPVILMTAFGKDITSAARDHGACAVFEKPFDVDSLVSAVCDELGFHVKGGPHSDGSPPQRHLMAARCASCNDLLGIRIEPQKSGVLFCASCWERARPPRQGEDLGTVD